MDAEVETATAPMRVTSTTRYEDLPEWLTVQQVADITGKKYWTIRQHICRGLIPYERTGWLYRIPRWFVDPGRAEAKAFIAEALHQVEASTQAAETEMAEPVRVDRSVRFETLPDLLSPSECAAWLGISTMTVYQQIWQRQIPFTRFGRQYRIPKTVLQTGVVS